MEVDPKLMFQKEYDMDDSPLDKFERIVSLWWLVALLAILGGLIGWAINTIKPAVYEGRASLVVYFKVSGRESYGETQSSYLLSTVAAIVSPYALGPTLVSDFEGDCKNISVDDLYLERRESVWDLVVRCSSAQGAADLANAWIDAAMSKLNTAYEHSVNVEALTVSLTTLNSCGNFPTQDICLQYSTIEEQQLQIKALQQEIRKEEQGSQGMVSNVSFRIESLSKVPVKPIANAPGLLIIAGMAIGLLVGILLVMQGFHLPIKKKQ